MLSVSGKNWKETPVNKRIIEKVKIDNNLSEIQSKILISRNFTQLEISSLKNEINLSNPFLKNSDFKKGHLIIEESIENNDTILIIGDYDVDGCVSTSLLVNFFKLLKKKVDYYIPDRFTDGYGANLDLVKRLFYLSTNIKTKFTHVRSHQKEPSKSDPEYYIWYGNSKADELAVNASKSIL